MKSASSAASFSRQQHVQRSLTEAEAEASTEVPMEIGADRRGALPCVMGKTPDAELPRTSLRWNFHPNSSAVPITPQEGIDGYREKGTVELCSIMELPATGCVLKWARQLKTLKCVASLRNTSGWNMNDDCRVTVAKHLPAKCSPPAVGCNAQRKWGSSEQHRRPRPTTSLRWNFTQATPQFPSPLKKELTGIVKRHCRVVQHHGVASDRLCAQVGKTITNSQVCSVTAQNKWMEHEG